MQMSRFRSAATSSTSVTALGASRCSLGVKDGQIRERRAGPIKRILRLGYSEDNQRLVFQTQYTFFTSSTSDGQFDQAKTAYCDGQYTTRSGTALFSLPLKLNTTGCYASATFSP